MNAPDGDPAVLIDKLGERFEIVNTDIKKWTVGTPIQAPLDAIDTMRRKHPFDADDVKSVAVRLAPTRRRRRGQPRHPRHLPPAHGRGDADRQDGVVPRRARQGAHAGRGRAAPARQGDVRAGRLARALLPARVAVVEIALKDGTRLSERVEAVRGTVRNPMTRAEVVEKARDLIAPVLGARPRRS